MSEKNDYKILKKHLPTWKDRFERVENIAGAGNPDINYCIDGVEGWIEMKSPIEKGKIDSKLFTGNNHKLLQSQKNWFLKQKNAGGKGYILIATDKRWMLIDGCKHADVLNDKSLHELIHLVKWYAERPVQKEDWDQLRRLLSE